MNIKNKLTVLKISLPIIAIILLIFSYRSLEILTYFWHLKNHHSIEWYDFKVKAPKKLMAKIGDYNGYNDLQIYYWRNPREVHIFFSREDCHLKENFNLQKLHKKLGYRIIEKTSYSISGFPCVWIKSSDAKDYEKEYQETIYFLTKDIRITFMGDKEQRKYLLEVIDNLKIKL